MTTLGTAALLATPARACLWDSDTLLEERFQSPELAKVVLDAPTRAPDTKRLLERIGKLQAERNESDPAWWNELAGAHIRLGEPQRAVELLEPAVKQFPKDYGVHANLGTAYHLLGRYREAEREIARDLEINPDAHFGLERYHLALLQYLVRDRDYQARHVYVDEFTLPLLLSAPFGGYLRKPEEQSAAGSPPLVRLETFVRLHGTKVDDLRTLWQEEAERAEKAEKAETASLSQPEPRHRLAALSAVQDPLPRYRERWNLGSDPQLERGVIYMATLNPREPACFAMLGVVCWKRGDLNLAIRSFERAIRLGSPQAELLAKKNRQMASNLRIGQTPKLGLAVAVGSVLVIWTAKRLRRRARRRTEEHPDLKHPNS